MAKNYDIKWNDKEMLLEVRGLALEQIDDLALEIVDESDPPIDTGFLDASAYVNSASGLNTFDERWPDGKFYSRRTGREEQRRSIDSPEPPPENGAVAGWAADYAARVEERTAFVYQAVQRVAARHRR